MKSKKTHNANDEMTRGEIIRGLEETSKRKFQFKPRSYEFTQKQKDLITKILDPRVKVIFIEGVAGTSKTLLAIYGSLKLLKENLTYNKILYIRSAVESSHSKLGALPGGVDEKIYNFMTPLMQKADELLETEDIAYLTNNKMLESTCINFLRGASWRDQIVVIDEAQNMNLKELQTVMTRIGENTKLIICGDTKQSDIKDSGLHYVVVAFSDEESVSHGIESFKFSINDIVRSEICKFIVKKFEDIK
jgi:predicted ribonuclease YlaK